MNRYFLYILIAILVSCNSDNDQGTLCTEEFIFGLSIEVKDATAGDPVIENITVVATDGTYSEELQITSDFLVYYGAGERAGDYIITITGDDYQHFVSDVITVLADECHVITEFRTFEIQPD